MAIDLLGKVPTLGEGEPFPPATSAKANGLLAIGGTVSPTRLKEALNQGIYPLCEPGKQTTWWSPNPRAVFALDNLTISKRRKAKLSALPYLTVANKDVEHILLSCAESGQRRLRGWMSKELQEVYLQLNKEGLLLSIGVHLEETLVGGIFGAFVTDKIFTAISMFHRRDQAGTLALCTLLQELKKRDCTHVDIQKMTDHTARFGAYEISQREYLSLLSLR